MQDNISPNLSASGKTGKHSPPLARALHLVADILGQDRFLYCGRARKRRWRGGALSGFRSVRESIWRRFSLGHIVRQRDGLVRYRVLCRVDRPRRQVVCQRAAAAIRHGRDLRRLHDVLLLQSRDVATCPVRQGPDRIGLFTDLGRHLDSRRMDRSYICGTSRRAAGRLTRRQSESSATLALLLHLLCRPASGLSKHRSVRPRVLRRRLGFLIAAAFPLLCSCQRQYRWDT